MLNKRAIVIFLTLASAANRSDAFAVGAARKTFAASTLSMSSVAAPEAIASYERAMDKMKTKDKTSKSLSKSDLKVVFEDQDVIVIDKPAGVLTVPNKDGDASLAQAVFESFGCESGKVDKMVAQRLGFDTSGLIVFARSNAAISSLNLQLRTQTMTRQYEALVCGTVSNDKGEITYELTRDADALPYMRVYTEEAQKKLIGMAKDLPKDLSDKLCQNEKKSCTEFDVVSREELSGHPVTRLSLKSVSGRTHQLNVHCAAMGHPIIGDIIYGVDGDASPNGGLSEEELSSSRAPIELQKEIATLGKGLCVHLKNLSFKHPTTGEKLTFESPSSF